jgi:Peptidase family M23
LLKRTTTLGRLVLPILVFLAWTPVAHAWGWPVQGAVLQPFAYDEAHPYAAGQHRGIDIGAAAAGEQVVAPAAGIVAFAGSVPTSGESVTIETGDGYSVTLTHLGSILVAKGGSVAEGDAVGTIGPSGTPDFDQPYVHLGIRVASDPNGYVDPLGFLPAPVESGPTQGDSSGSQPSSSGEASSSPAPSPAPVSSAAEPVAATSAPPAATSRAPVRSPVASQQSRGRTTRSHTVGAAVPARPAAASSARSEIRRPQPASAGVRPRHAVATPHRGIDAPPRASHRPVVEAAVPGEPPRLDAGHEPRASVRGIRPSQPEHERPSVLLPLVCNGAAALVALAAAFAAGRSSRRRTGGSPTASAQVLHLPRPAVELGRGRRAA